MLHRIDMRVNTERCRSIALMAVRVGLLIALVGGLWPPITVQAQSDFTFPVAITFKDASAPGWVLGGAARLTSGVADPVGDGWLRLTSNDFNQAGYAYYNTPIPTGRGLVVTFDYAAWGGTGADGLSFFLFDGATPTFKVGASGGSLGFAQKIGVNGLSGGYLGLGLDEFGNYSNPTEGRVGGTTFTPNAVAVRGPGVGTTGYDYLAGTTRLDRAPWNLPRLDCPNYVAGCGNGATRPSDAFYFRQVQIVVTPVGAAYQVRVAMKFSKYDAAWTPLFGPFTMPTSAPGTLKMGFAASTGGSYNFHEIRNLNVTQQVPDLTATKSVQNVTTGGGSVAPGEELLYSVVLNNNTNSAISGVAFTDTLPANTTYVANSIAIPYGATLHATDPISITNITVPAAGQAAISFKVRVVNPIPPGVTQISNQGAYTYGAVSALTDGDMQTEGAQPTLISVTAGPNFDTSTKTVSYEDLDGNGAVSPGDRLTYRVTLPNTGNQNAPIVTFADVIPSNTTYVANSASVSGGAVSYNSTTRTLNWTVSVAAGNQATLEFKVTVNSGVKIRDVISNQGTLTYNGVNVLTDADLTTPGKQPTQILAGGGATLTATKFAEVVGGGPLQPGGQIRYTILLTNTGSYPVANATFADTIPAHTTYVSASTDNGVAVYSAPALSVTGINLASGARATIQLTVQLDNPLTGVTQISNQGVVSYDSNQGGVNNTMLQTDGDPATPGQQPTYTAIPHTDLALTKLVNNNRPAEAGSVIYTVRVVNQGPASADNVTVTDAVPAGLTLSAASVTTGAYISPTWFVGSLANGADATLMLTATVNLGQGGRTITNTASVAAALYDANPGDNTASAGLIAQTTTLSGTVTDASSGVPLVSVTLMITDSLGNTCTATTAAGGAYLVTSGQNGCLLAPGVATVGAVGGAPAGYLLRTAPAIIVAGAANIGNLTLVQPSLSGFVTDLGSGVPLVGAVVTMTQGSEVCTTTVAEGGLYRFVAGVGCALAPGPATVVASLRGYQNAAATPTILDTGPTFHDLAPGTADLLILKDDGKNTVAPGELLDYVITLINQGSITGAGVIVTDTLPAYLEYVASSPPASNPAAGIYVWTPADIAPGEIVSFTLQARVAISLPDGVIGLSNYANLTATSPDRDRTNNEVADVDTVTAHPDLTLFKSATADSSPIGAGQMITYTYIGDNRGSAFATSVRITDTLDVNTTYVDGSAVLVVGATTWPLTATYVNALHQLLLELPDMPPGAEGYLRYRAMVADILPPGVTSVTNTAEVTSDQVDLNPRNNQSTVVLSALPGANIYVQKTALAASVPVLPGNEILYRLRYGNLSSGIATDVVLTDVIPINTGYIAGSLYLDGVNLSDAAGDDAGAYVNASRMLSITLGDLAGGASGVVTFTVRVDDVLPAGVTTIDNTAAITATVADPAPGDNMATAMLDVAAQPDLSIVKQDGVSQVQAGEWLTYTIAYSNTGSQVATGVQITDTLLAGLEYIGATPPGSYDSGANTIVWTIGALPVNDMRTLTVTAQVKADAQPGSVVANRVMITDDGANGEDANPAGNIFTDSDVVIAPYIALEKHAAGPVYVGQPLTYTIEGYNSQYGTAYNVVVTDVLPANTMLVPGSVSPGGVVNGNVITWDMGDVAPGVTGTLSFAVIPQPGAGGMTQTLPTLTTESISGAVTITSSTIASSTGSRPWCDFDGCASFRGIYQGENGLPSAGWNDNPRLTPFNDAGWTQPVAASDLESMYWLNPAELSAQWVTMHTDGETMGNFSFFRQNFCMPLNAIGLDASIQLAGDDVADIYLNGVYVGQEVGAGAADAFDAGAGVQPGINLLSVQLLNNRHGGHDKFDGGDHSGLIFNMQATYTGLRPFAAAPSSTLANQPVLFTIAEEALDGRAPYSYTIDFGDSVSIGYQTGVSFVHTYTNAGVYTVTVTARSQDGCTGRDQLVVTVLPEEVNLLANPVLATYRDGRGRAFAATGGAGVELRPAADLSILKTVPTGSRVPGQTVTYQITVTNYGPSNVMGATVTDTMPVTLTSVTWGCQASAGSLCTSSGSDDLVDTVNILAGGVLTYVVTGMLPPDATGLLENSAGVTAPASVADLAPNNNLSTDSGELTPSAELIVSKYSTPNPGLAPGYPVHYIIRVENAGPSAAAGVLVTDTFPTTITGVTWRCLASSGSSCTPVGNGDLTDTATILVGGVLTYTVTGSVDPGAPVGTVLENMAVARFAGVPIEATDANTLVAPTMLVASKVALDNTDTASSLAPYNDLDGNGGVSPGDILKYRVVITTGPATAYDVVLDDRLDTHTQLRTGTVTCNPACNILKGSQASDDMVSVHFASLAAHSTAIIEYEVMIDSVLPFQLAAIANQGLVASANAPVIATDDPATAEPNDPTIVMLTMGALRGVVWADDGDGMIESGEPPLPDVTVTLYYTDVNGNPQSAGVNTDVSGAYTFTVLAAGDYHIGVTVREGFRYGVIWGADKDNKIDPANGLTPVITLAANQQLANVSAGQLSVLAFGYLPASFANTTLAQNGARHIVPDAVDARLYLGSGIVTGVDGVESPTASGPGDGIVRAFVPRWKPGATGVLTVTASGAGVLWGWFDWNASGHFEADEGQELGAVITGTQTVNVVVGAAYSEANPLFARFRLYTAAYGLEIQAAASAYNGEVEDYGWFAVHGVVFEDVNGNGVWDAGEGAPAGATVVITDSRGVVQQMAPDASGVYTAPLRAGVATVEVRTPPHYVQIAGVNPQTITVGIASDVGIDGYLSPPMITGAVYDDRNFNGAYDVGEPGLPGVTLTTGVVSTTTDASGAYTFTLTPGTYTITATNLIGYLSTGDVNPPNDDVIPGIALVSGQKVTDQNFFDTLPADLSLTKTASNLTPRVGDVIAFLVTVTNTGPGAASGVIISDVMPIGYSYLGSFASTGSFDAGRWMVGNLPAPGQATLFITATVKASGGYSNYAEIAACDQYDPDSTPGDHSTDQDDDDSVTPTPRAVADLSISKVSTPRPFMPGAAITYTIVVTNAGPSSVTALTVTEQAPDALSDIVYSPSAGLYDGSSGAWNGVTLAPGGQIILTVTGVVSRTHQSNLINLATVAPFDAIDPEAGNNQAIDVNTPAPGSVMGSVYHDVNGNGGRDAGEPGLAQVTVIITDSLGVTHTTTTDANGVYTVTLPFGIAVVDIDDATLPFGAVHTGGADPSPVTVVSGLTDAGAVGFWLPAPRFDPALRVMPDMAGLPALVEGDDIRFIIELYNQGTMPVQNLTLVDYLPPGMMLSPNEGNGWQATGNMATLRVTGPILPGQMMTTTITLRVGDAYDQVINAVEIVSAQDGDGVVQADADAVNDAVNGNDPVIDDALDGNGSDDEDDHDIASFFVERVDVALTKQLAEGQPALVRAGDDVRFTLTITNQGSVTLGAVVVCDHIPTGFVLSPNDSNGWEIDANGAAMKTLQTPLSAGQSITVEIVLRVVQQTEGSARNWAEIVAIRDPAGNDLTDADSTPNNGDLPEDDSGGADFVVAPAPTVIQLATFEVSGEQGAANLRWSTADENGVQGFLLYRSTDEELSHAEQVTPSLIPAVGAPAQYTVVDVGVTMGQSYWYWLAFVLTSDRIDYYGPRHFVLAPTGGDLLYLPVVVR